MISFLDRPQLAVRQRAAADEAARPRICRAKLDQGRRLFLLGNEQMSSGQERHSFAPGSLRAGPVLRNSGATFHDKINRRYHLWPLEIDKFDTRRRLLEQQDATEAISADSLDL